MSAEQNKALLRRIFEEAFNQNKPSVLDELIAPNFRTYDPPLGMEPNREGFRQILAKYHATFPDMHLTIEDEFADGDYVIQRGYATGTHKGEFQGLPPTEKKVKINVIHIWRFANGKAVENWVQMDQLGLMQQLGAIPQPAHSHSG
jgi:predicted ester cyclase